MERRNRNMINTKKLASDIDARTVVENLFRGMILPKAGQRCLCAVRRDIVKRD